MGMGLEPLNILTRPRPSVTQTPRLLLPAPTVPGAAGAQDAPVPAAAGGQDAFVPAAGIDGAPGRLEAFQHGVERAADVITKGSGVIGGAMIGYEAVSVGIDLLPAAVGATLAGGPIAHVAVGIGLGLDAVLGGTIGYKLASKVSQQAGRWGEKLSSRMGLTSKGGAAAVKSSVAVARSAMVLACVGFAIGHPILVPLIGVLGVGTAMAASGVGHAARHLRQ